MRSPLVHTPPVQAAAVLAEGHLQQAFDIAVVSNTLPHVRRRFVGMRRLTLAELVELCGISLEASLEAPGQVLAIGQAGDRELVEVVAHHGSGHVRVAADSPEAADELVDRLAALLQEEERPADPRVPIWFWTLSEHGPDSMRRRLHAPFWNEISGNYVPAVRDALSQIMASPPDSARGVALWRGAPGTGKTTALRALAQEWRDHVDVHVIVDPEVFLGERASYLVDVLFGHDLDEYWDGDGDADGGPTITMSHVALVEGPGAMLPMHGATYLPGMAHAMPAGPRRQKAKLIVLEDAGELISADARVSAGQALSRLLNLTDGMLGQGANVSVLVTTNEPIDRLHDAVARPGRSWAHLEFGALATDAANDWLQQAGSADRVDAPATIAELYGIMRGDQVVTLDDLES
jgi:hypothetical protein